MFDSQLTSLYTSWRRNSSIINHQSSSTIRYSYLLPTIITYLHYIMVWVPNIMYNVHTIITYTKIQVGTYNTYYYTIYRIRTSIHNMYEQVHNVCTTYYVVRTFTITHDDYTLRLPFYSARQQVATYYILHTTYYILISTHHAPSHLNRYVSM